MKTRSLMLLLTALTFGASTSQSIAAGEPSTKETTLRIHSVRVSRSSPEFNKRFSGRYYGEGTPGVNLQLLLTLANGTILPIARDAVAIETFIDDTYQSLMRTGNESSFYSGNNPSVVSDDGRTLLFTVSSSRVPADDATRVFVRGSIQARVSRGIAIVATNPVSIMVGQAVTVGPFRTTIRSVSDQGGSLSVMLSIEGDASRVQKIRVLDAADNVLNDGRQNRVTEYESGDRPVTTHLTLRNPPKQPVTLEYTYTEKTESVKIPFEAQVDIGVAKAGPIEPSEGKPRKSAEVRTWPPPRDAVAAALPPVRTAFNPTNEVRTATKPGAAKFTNAAVDLFSITVAKPTPAEAKDARWAAAPAATFYASGFTVARLLLSTPGLSIVSVPADGINVTRFEDDKGGRLDTALYRDTSSPLYSSSSQYARRSAEGQQVLLNLSLASAPTPGATRCTLAGSVRATVTRGELTNTSPTLELQSGKEFIAGPFKGKFGAVRQLAPFTPSSFDGTEIEAWLTLSGPIDKVRTVELLDSTQRVLNSNRIDLPERPNAAAENINYGLRLAAAPTGPVTLRICHHESSEIIEVPFEISTGIGL